MAFKIAPSLAAAPLTRLEDVVAALEAGGADYIHIDIEDGSFVPVMTLGTKIIPDLRPLTNLPFDVHLMMVNPEWLIPQLVAQGADIQFIGELRRTLEDVYLSLVQNPQERN